MSGRSEMAGYEQVINIANMTCKILVCHASTYCIPYEICILSACHNISIVTLNKQHTATSTKTLAALCMHELD